MVSIDKKQVAQACRILGVHVSATLEDLKAARNRLAKLYHPDKHQDISEQAQQAVQERFQIVQSAYDFMKNNKKAIQDSFSHLEDYGLISKGNRLNRSHWVYSAVAAM